MGGGPPLALGGIDFATRPPLPLAPPLRDFATPKCNLLNLVPVYCSFHTLKYNIAAEVPLTTPSATLHPSRLGSMQGPVQLCTLHVWGPRVGRLHMRILHVDIFAQCRSPSPKRSANMSDAFREFRDRLKMPPPPQLPMGNARAIQLLELQECFNDVEFPNDWF